MMMQTLSARPTQWCAWRRRQPDEARAELPPLAALLGDDAPTHAPAGRLPAHVGL